MQKILFSKRTKYFDFFAVCAIVFIVVLLFVGIKEEEKIAKKEEIIKNAPSKRFELDEKDIEGKSAIVFDIKKGEFLFEKNSELQLPLASITKTMTVLTAIENAPEFVTFKIQKEDLLEEGDSGLLVGDKWSIKNIAKFILVNSSNDGARALASVVGGIEKGESDLPSKIKREAFISLMNKKAEELKLNQTYFLNETGLDENSQLSGGYGSAKDVTKIFEKAIEKHKEIFELTRYKDISLKSETEKLYNIKNTNISTDDIPFLIASKTGYTDLAGGNLAIAFEAGFERPVVAVVLGSSQKGRFEDIKKMVNASIKYITNGDSQQKTN